MNPKHIPSESSHTLRSILSRDFLRNRITTEVQTHIQNRKSIRWSTEGIDLIIQKGKIICCTDEDDWIWIVRRIAILFDISDKYATSTLQEHFNFDLFPFLSKNEIRDILRSRTEHNIFVFCNTSQHKKFPLTKVHSHESKIQEILERTGGFFGDISLPTPNVNVDILWRNRKQKKIYQPLMPFFDIKPKKTDLTVPKQHLSLEDLLFDSDLDPYHTLQKITKNIPFPMLRKKTSTYLQSTFFVSHQDQIRTQQIFDNITQNIISVLHLQISMPEIIDWFSYHVSQLPIEYQMSLYENTLSESFISDIKVHQPAIYELLLRLSKSKRLRENRNWIYNQLYQVQCI